MVVFIAVAVVLFLFFAVDGNEEDPLASTCFALKQQGSTKYRPDADQTSPIYSCHTLYICSWANPNNSC